jgi:hypothetical protein
MRAFKTKWFAQFARQEFISDANLREAIARAERGLIDADLRGGLIKQRVARPGKGRSGGYRVIVAYRAKGRAVFLFGFAKSDRENVDSRELESLRAFGNRWLTANETQIALGIREDEIQEVTDDQEAQQIDGSDS